MRDANNTIRILLIRAWTEPLAPLRAALEAHDLNARFHRVDIEPALNAALDRDNYTVIVFDPRTPGITRETLDSRMRANRRTIPVVTLGDPRTLAEDILQILRSHAN
jgi:tRNA/tmRNA/rRNA uracil-C5-methylase (TrmA/RlmC/RlmD family)